MIQKICMYCMCGLLSNSIIAQQAPEATDRGILAGSVLDEEGEGIPGANIWINVLQKGIATDIMGHFRLENLPVGTHEVRFSYVSYQTELRALNIASGEVLEVKIALIPTATELLSIEIKTEEIRDNTQAMIDLKRKSVHMLEGLSATQIQRIGDNHLGNAMKRMTGVTIVEDQYVYVRGLGDRYNRTALNGASIPGLDPTRNSTQMDLFPSHFINNVVIYKTFSADLPGDFAGGYIDIETKNIPTGPTMHLSSSTSYNVNANFNENFLTYTGGATDWLGIDDGTRRTPISSTQTVPNIGIAERSTEAAQSLQAATRGFGTQEMVPYQDAMPLNHRLSASFGNRHKTHGQVIGYMASLLHQRTFERYEDGLSAVYKQRGQHSQTLSPLLSLEDTKNDANVLLSGLFGIGYQAPRHQVLLNLIHTQKGVKTIRQQIGTKPEDDPDLQYFTQGMWYSQKGISTAQLKGTHKIGDTQKWSMNWLGSHTFSRIYQPDLRFFTYGHDTSADEVTPYYSILPSIGQLPTRYFRDMREQLSDAQFHLKRSTSVKGTLQAGSTLNVKLRTFSEKQYRYENDLIASIPNDPSHYVMEEKLWNAADRTGTYILDASITANNYKVMQSVWSTYFLFAQPLWHSLDFSAGLRYEGTQLFLISQDRSKGTGQLLLHDFLPSVKLTYRTYGDKMVLRSAYGRTLARPSFRELAPFSSFDFIGDYILVGNPELERTLIDNLDVSADYYPRRGDIFAVGLFYKRFVSPIERTFNIEAANPELTFRNVPEAQAMGMEISVQKSLRALGNIFTPFSIGSNLSLVHSWVDIDPKELLLIRSYNIDASAHRPLYGQAPYVLNAYINYKKAGWEGNVAYNIFGKRLFITAPDGPGIYERPRHNIDLNFSKQVARMWKFRLGVRNLLNIPHRFVQVFQQTDYSTQTHRTGRQISLSLSYTVE